MKNILLVSLIFCMSGYAFAEEYHVSKSGSDKNSGSAESPFLTVSKAASIARPGDVVTVHEGTYREWVNPRNSGANKYSPIVYRAAEGEEVWIKGSEQITNWTKDGKGNVWKVVLPNSYFGEFNPYAEILGGDWLYVTQPYFCLGEVYLNNKWAIHSGFQCM